MKCLLYRSAVWMFLVSGVAWLGGCAAPSPFPGTSAPAPAAAVEDGPAMRVMSFNLRRPVILDGVNHWPNRRQRVVRFIEQNQPDVIGMQECTASQADYLALALPQYGIVGAGREDGARAGEMCAVFYRRDRFTLSDRRHFWLSDTPERPGSKSWGNVWTRMVTWVKLDDRHTGEGFYLFNTHFSVASRDAREASAALLAQRIGSIAGHAPVLVTGDFNAPADSTTHRVMTGRRSRIAAAAPLRDTFRVANPRVRDEPGTRHHFIGNTAGPRIDWVLSCRRFDVLAAGVLAKPIDQRYVSDHHPVFAVVQKRGTRVAAAERVFDTN